MDDARAPSVGLGSFVELADDVDGSAALPDDLKGLKPSLREKEVMVEAGSFLMLFLVAKTGLTARFPASVSAVRAGSTRSTNLSVDGRGDRESFGLKKSSSQGHETRTQEPMSRALVNAKS